ncbi:MAG TPA: hypothetical protein VMT99_02520 [Candidatus Paceibacterota bacterium]|nr:hypothetical protein [Candidatus Paceibacterota bacterium]
MRERIARVKERLAARVRTLRDRALALSRRKRGRRPDSHLIDIRTGAAPKTVMLRELILHVEFEVSRRAAKKFAVTYRRPLIAFAAVFILGLFVRFLLVGFATTVDFYPSSCLGSWDNVQNALGRPEVAAGSPGSSFTGLNSAVFSTGTQQMFCGNFSGDVPISDLAGKNFQSATLVLSWYVDLPQAAPASGGGGGGASAAPVSTSDVTAASSTDDAASSTAATSTVPAPSDGATSTSPSPAAPASDGGTASSTDASAPLIAPSSDTVSSSSSETPPPPAPAPEPTPLPSPEPTPVPTPAPATPAPDATPPPPSSPTSWLFELMPQKAYADATSAAAVADSSTALMATTTEGVPTTATPPAPITVNTSVFQNIILPSSTPGDFLGLVYSTDGTTWQPLVNIHDDNWQSGRYPIPISSWDELAHLQVAFVGLGTSDAPKVYLDAAGVEVSYVDTPEGTTTITPPADQSSAADGSVAADTAASSPDATGQPDTTATDIPPQDILQQPAIPQADVFQQGAHQQCVAAPFSQTVARGTSASYAIELFSGLTTPSTTVKPGASAPSLPNGYQHPLYSVRLGSLPPGVSSSLVPGPVTDATSTVTATLSASARAARGSYSLLVIYRERQDDASLRSTGCQLNLVVQ